MNIIVRELRSELKAFILWLIAPIFLNIIELYEFGAMDTDGGESISALFDKFPRIVLAVFGVVDIDLGTSEGYYAIIAYYMMICTCIYAIHLGSSAITRDAADKTSDFLYSKPVSRSYAVGMKLTARGIYLVAYSVFNALTAMIGVRVFSMGDIDSCIIIYAVASLIVSLLYFSLGMFGSALAKKPSKGSLAANLLFWGAFLLAIIYDMLENGALLRFFTPLKYFPAGELVDGTLNTGYTLFVIAASAILLTAGFMRFEKKDFPT